ncbi:DinB family protein [Oceanibium sediminis]|uniref:DinB family protein n=1 Tax=Oceanibium sediminis TaxID=2026339 RepID=UPI000DD2BFEB|nr:DinB family protein [Oceanibium sediminis]
MSAQALFAGFASNNAYANRTLFGAITGLDRAAFNAPRPGFFPSLSATLNHIYEVDLYYLDALEGAGQGLAVFERPEIAEVADLAAAQAVADARLCAFCDAPGDPARLVGVARATGMTRERVDAVLAHLFQHQIHHRGQAHVQMGDAGIAPPQLDEFFLDYERAPLATELRAGR